MPGTEDPDVRAPTAFVLHPASALHDTGWGHPEHQGRLRALATAVGRDLPALAGRVEQAEAVEADRADLLRVHTEAHVATVEAAAERAARVGRIAMLDPDTCVSAHSWEAAAGAVGAALAGVHGVADGRYRNAFVATRPPGHHATPGRAMGFCLLNTVACAARWLQAESLAERVLIVDWDVHHGNGTQDVFWEDSSVFYLSLHQSPHYPGTGRESERGGGPGEGYTRNVELRAGTSRQDYLEAFESSVDQALAAMEPDFLLVSAGFDCLAGDPLGGLLLEPDDLYQMTRILMERADRFAGDRLVACLEGGYAPERTAEAAVAVIRALAGAEPSR